jgi:hypothetical protein
MYVATNVIGIPRDSEPSVTAPPSTSLKKVITEEESYTNMYVATNVIGIPRDSEPSVTSPPPTPLKKVIIEEQVKNVGGWNFLMKEYADPHVAQAYEALAYSVYDKIEAEANLEFSYSQKVKSLEGEIGERLSSKWIENLSDVYPQYPGKIRPLSWRHEDDSWLHSQQRKIEEAKKEHEVAKKAWIVKKLNETVLPMVQSEALNNFFVGSAGKPTDNLLTFEDKYGLSTLF